MATKQGKKATYEKTSFSVYPDDIEWFKDLKWHLTLTKGMTRYKDVFAEAVCVLKKEYPNIVPRPERTRKMEREQGRLKKE